MLAISPAAPPRSMVKSPPPDLTMERLFFVLSFSFEFLSFFTLCSLRSPTYDKKAKSEYRLAEAA